MKLMILLAACLVSGCGGGGGESHTSAIPANVPAPVQTSVPSSVILTAPELQQLSMNQNFLCGPDVIVTLSRIYYPPGLSIFTVADELEPNRDGTTADQLSSYLNGHGFNSAVIYCPIGSVDWVLKNALSHNSYCIPLVKTGGPADNSGSLHWFLVYGYNDTEGFFVADSIPRPRSFFAIAGIADWMPFSTAVIVTAKPFKGY